MNDIVFKAYATVNEIDLNAIAVECGIPRKYTWEEPLKLTDKILFTILNREPVENQVVYIFSFGSVVFTNCSKDDETVCFSFIRSIQRNMIVKDFKYFEGYRLRVSETPEIELMDKRVVVSSYELYQPDIISTVIAKSVALEKIEVEMIDIVDAVEPLIDRHQKGKLRVRERRLANIKSRISRYQYNTIAYIMILDKPDITWIKSDAGEFYDLLSEFFELNDRYEILTKKTELLNNVMDGMESTSRLVRSTIVEMLVLFLIFVEVVIMLVELFS